MTDLDFKRELAELLNGEPAGPDPVRALRSGRRALVRRRCASSAASFAGVVAVAAAVPLGVSAFSRGPSGGTTPGGGTSELHWVDW